jgi:hypothetical protein
MDRLTGSISISIQMYTKTGLPVKGVVPLGRPASEEGSTGRGPADGNGSSHAEGRNHPGHGHKNTQFPHFSTDNAGNSSIQGLKIEERGPPSKL